MGKVAFYHYTNKSGKDAIVNSEKILKSDGPRDAHFGIGVYGTSLDPSTGIRKIAWNNYDGIVNLNKGMLMRAAWAIKVMIPEDEVDEADSKRDILVYRSGDLDLTNYEWEVIKVPH